MNETLLNTDDSTIEAPAVKPLHNIVIVGGGAVGWTVAAALAARLGILRPKIIVIAHPSIDQPIHCDSTSPRANYFHALLGADERALLKAGSGTFKLGVEYRGFGTEDTSVVHAFGDYGLPYAGVNFHQLPARLTQGYSGYERYSLAAVALRHNKFVHPQGDASSIFSSLHYGLHLCAAGYADYLKTLAVSRGVICLNQPLTRVNYDKEANRILSVVLGEEASTGQAGGGEVTVEGELFIDCTGSQALLMQKMQGFNFCPDTHLSGITRIVSAEMVADKSMTPASQLRAAGFAIINTIPLQNRHVLTAYLSAKIDDEQLATQLETVFNLPVKTLESRPLLSGRLSHAWLGNCIAMGEAAGVLPNLGVSSLELVRNAVVRLLDYFPDAGFSYGNSAEYNRLTQTEFERTLEQTSFILFACCRGVGELAQYCLGFSLPDRVEHKLTLFQQTACVAGYAEDLLSESEWASLMVSLGFFPIKSGVTAQQLPEQEVIEWCAMLERKIETACLGMPEHMSYLRRFINS